MTPIKEYVATLSKDQLYYAREVINERLDKLDREEKHLVYTVTDRSGYQIARLKTPADLENFLVSSDFLTFLRKQDGKDKQFSVICEWFSKEEYSDEDYFGAWLK